MAPCWNPADWRPESSVLCYSCKKVNHLIAWFAQVLGNVANHRVEGMKLLVLTIVVLSGCSQVTGLDSISFYQLKRAQRCADVWGGKENIHLKIKTAS